MYVYLHHKTTFFKMLKMIGVYECKIDIKSRVMLPSALKSQLDACISEGFIIKRSIFQKCLEIYTRSAWEEAIKDISKLNKFVQKNNDFIRVFMAGVKEIELDAMGRFLVPKDLASFAGLSKDIVLASAVDIIELWDKDKYEAKILEDQSNFADLAELVMGQIK